jgi:hypothetical protein
VPKSRGSAPSFLNPIIRFIIAIVLPPKWLPEAVKRTLNPRRTSCATMRSYFPAPVKDGLEHWTVLQYFLTVPKLWTGVYPHQKFSCHHPRNRQQRVYLWAWMLFLVLCCDDLIECDLPLLGTDKFYLSLFGSLENRP